MLRDGFAGIYPRAALPAMIDLLDGWRPDVVIREELEFASLVAAERRGIRHVQVATGLLSTQSYCCAPDPCLRQPGCSGRQEDAPLNPHVMDDRLGRRRGGRSAAATERPLDHDK